MKNKKRIRIIFLAFVLFAGAFAFVQWRNAQQEGEIERYVYPTDFNDCWGVIQKKAKCRIPEEILSEMSVEELVWAVIDYPFLFESLCSPRLPGGISEWAAGISDAFKKLTECRNPENKIIKVLKQAYEEECEDRSKVSLARLVFYDGQRQYFDFSKKQLKFLKGN